MKQCDVSHTQGAAGRLGLIGRSRHVRFFPQRSWGKNQDMSEKSGYGTYPDFSLASGDQPESIKKDS
ncbi:hypothetical protein CON74_25180 [Bacillus thuringiensis]|nr:hypothetical protein CON74_25180 [Bacillus thuringiensis]PEE96949.1 hypothetical protein CON21_30940 [Bacillus thuringiensis]PGR96142.1 hypothetical protein COC68_16295 [Bacillus thuringiensis]PGX90698.1 hypothetical protein COE39_26200 [Bacillus thuringiensis]